MTSRDLGLFLTSPLSHTNVYLIIYVIFMPLNIYNFKQDILFQKRTCIYKHEIFVCKQFSQALKVGQNKKKTCNQTLKTT